jgi:hypothetical protein
MHRSLHEQNIKYVAEEISKAVACRNTYIYLDTCFDYPFWLVVKHYDASYHDMQQHIIVNNPHHPRRTHPGIETFVYYLPPKGFAHMLRDMFMADL